MDNFDYLSGNDYEEDEEIKRLRHIINNGPTGPTIEKEEAVVGDASVSGSEADAPTRKTKKHSSRSHGAAVQGNVQAGSHEHALSEESSVSSLKTEMLVAKVYLSKETHMKMKLMCYLLRKSLSNFAREVISKEVDEFYANLKDNTDIDMDVINLIKKM